MSERKITTFFRGLYGAYAALIFLITFIFFFLLLMIPVALPKKWKLVGMVNRIWAKCFFTLLFIPYEVEYRFKPDPNQQYIFCINHSSYLDIASGALNKINAIFVGKNDMESIPFFGFMYRKLHITVNRNSLKGRYKTFIKTCGAIDAGKSLMIFPEGGILTAKAPEMTRFKDGAFRLAIEKQIAVIPVTIPFNWIILPDSSFLPKWHKMKVIFHEPLKTEGLTIKELPALKQKTFEIINSELKRQLNEN